MNTVVSCQHHHQESLAQSTLLTRYLSLSLSGAVATLSAAPCLVTRNINNVRLHAHSASIGWLHRHTGGAHPLTHGAPCRSVCPLLPTVAECKPAAGATVAQPATSETASPAANAHIVRDTERVSETGLQRLGQTGRLTHPPVPLSIHCTAHRWHSQASARISYRLLLSVCLSPILLAASTSLRVPLQSAELQRILLNIDSASDRAARLDEYRHNNADFAAFIEQMLATLTGTADKQQSAEDVDLDALLQTLAHASWRVDIDGGVHCCQ